MRMMRRRMVILYEKVSSCRTIVMMMVMMRMVVQIMIMVRKRKRMMVMLEEKVSPRSAFVSSVIPQSHYHLL